MESESTAAWWLRLIDNSELHCTFSHKVQQVRKGKKQNELVIPPGIEPGTLSVLDSRDNHYTMESTADWLLLIVSITVVN